MAVSIPSLTFLSYIKNSLFSFIWKFLLLLIFFLKSLKHKIEGRWGYKQVWQFGSGQWCDGSVSESECQYSVGRGRRRAQQRRVLACSDTDTTRRTVRHSTPRYATVRSTPQHSHHPHVIDTAQPQHHTDALRIVLFTAYTRYMIVMVTSTYIQRKKMYLFLHQLKIIKHLPRKFYARLGKFTAIPLDIHF